MSNKVSNLFWQTAAALMLATLLSPAVWAVPASSGRPQTLASADAVPEGLSAPEWSSIRQQYEQHRHAAFPVSGGHQVRNPGQQWQTRFDGRGFTVTSEPGRAALPRRPLNSTLAAPSPEDQGRAAAQPHSSEECWQWGLELTSYGFAGSERTVSGKPQVNTVGQRVTYDWDATLQEWFVNDQRGLEHGFTVRERPYQPGSNDRQVLECASPLALCNLGDAIGSALGLAVGVGRADEKRQRAGALQDAVAPSLSSPPSTLNFLLAVRGGLRPEVQADGRGARFVDAQGGAALTYSELTVLDADGRKLPARFELVAGGASVLASRAGLVETWLVSSLAPPESPEGIAPCLRLVIDERGARYPLTIDPIAQQAYLKASHMDANGEWVEFGISVAVSGDTVVVGAWGESSNATGVNGDGSDTSAPHSGAAYVFVRNGTAWTQQAYLKSSNTDAGDYFGISVAVAGDTVVVGAYNEDSNATGVDGDGSDNSAESSGAAYVFVRIGTTWTQQAYLKASNTDAEDYFGHRVAVSGDIVVVGAQGEDSNATGVNGDGSDNSGTNSGAAYVFVRYGTPWTQQAFIKASNTEVGGSFSYYSVAVSGDTVVVAGG